MKPQKFILVGTDTAEVYVTQLGQVAVSQSRKDADHFICLSPNDVPELICYLTAAAQALEHSSVKLWNDSKDKRKPFYAARVDGCATRLSPDGGLEVHLGCVPEHPDLPVHRMFVKFHEGLFREVALDGLQLLDHKPPAVHN